MTPIIPLTHEEYQRTVQEVLVPLLNYKTKWEELKGQIEHAVEQAELGLAVAEDPKSFPKRTVEAQYGDILYHRGRLAELRKIEKIIEKLENS